MNLLGYQKLPDGVVIESSDNMRVCFHSEHGNIAIQVYKLSHEVPGPIYFINYNKESGNFGCTIIEHGEDIGIFQYPEYLTEDLEELKEIKGATKPEAILDKLGVNPSIINYP